MAKTIPAFAFVVGAGLCLAASAASINAVARGTQRMHADAQQVTTSYSRWTCTINGTGIPGKTMPNGFCVVDQVPINDSLENKDKSSTNLDLAKQQCDSLSGITGWATKEENDTIAKITSLCKTIESEYKLQEDVRNNAYWENKLHEGLQIIERAIAKRDEPVTKQSSIK